MCVNLWRKCAVSEVSSLGIGMSYCQYSAYQGTMKGGHGGSGSLVESLMYALVRTHVH